jgi:hypothetical protein
MGRLVGILTDREMAVLSALPGVSNPWLLHAGPSQIGVFVEIYLSPSTATDRVRRGTLIVAGRRSTATEGSSWSLGPEPKRAYAQVVIEGRFMDQVLSPLDANRPFEVRGTPTDDDLVDIVTFIRSIPTTQYANAVGQFTVVMGNRPIRSITKLTANGAIVEIYIDDGRGQRVTLERTGSTWVALSAVEWIA